VLSEHRFDGSASVAIDASCPLRPEFSLHELFWPIRVGEPLSGRIHLSEFFAPFPVFGSRDEQLGLVIRQLRILLAPIASVGKLPERVLAGSR
jgi:hypothetical protein